MTNRRILLGASGALLVMLPVGAYSGFFNRIFSGSEGSWDVIVVGAGAAGLSAAVEAAGAGAKVLVLEKQPEIGGNTLISGGFYSAVDPERQSRQGIADSVELFFDQFYKYGGFAARPELVEHVVANATEGLHWLESLGMHFRPEVFELYGAHWPRCHFPTLPLGQGYIRTLSSAALERGVEIRTSSAVKDILFEKGRAVGVTVAEPGDGTARYLARRGVVIASGSFASNPKLVAQYAPRLAGLTTNNTPASTGEVMMAAHKHGVALRDMQYIQCLPGCPPGKKHRVRFHNDVGHFILVDKSGHRFIREDGPRDELRDAVLALSDRYGFMVIDGAGFREAGILVQKEAIQAYEAGEAWKGNTVRELAQHMGLPPDELEKTVHSYNSGILEGKDAFGKTITSLTRPIAEPPFWACYAGMTLHYTEGGLAIDVRARCLDDNGRPVPGLYAAGTVTGGVHGKNRLGGCGLADAVVFGRTAGQEAARLAPL